MGDSKGGGFKSAITVQDPLTKQKQDAVQARADWAKQQGAMPGMQTPPASDFEIDAGVNPVGYHGLTDNNGQLLNQYKFNPFEGQASQRLRDEAFSDGPTKLAQAQLESQKFEESGARNKAGLQAQAAQSGAQSGLQRFGGLSSGSRTSLARQGMRDLMSANQGVGAQGVQARLGIGANDASLKQQLLGTTADVERQGGVMNLQNQLGSLQGENAYNTNRYNQQLAAWGAKKTAEGTAAAGRSGGGKK